MPNMTYGATGEDVLVDGVATSIINLKLLDQVRIGGQIVATTYAMDGLGEIHARTETFVFTAVTKVNVVTASMSVPVTSGLAASSGTLTTTWSILVGVSELFIQVLADTSLLNPVVDWHMIANGNGTIGDGILA